MKTESPYTSFLVKPDGIRDRLVTPIFNEFEQAGFRFLLSSYVQVDRETAFLIYEDHQGNDNFVYAVGSLLADGDEINSVVSLIYHPEGDALNKAQTLKGNANKSGLRIKFRKHETSDLDRRGIVGPERKRLLSQNRLHVPDSDEQASLLALLMFSASDLSQLIRKEEKLADFLQVGQQEITEKLLLRRQSL